MSASANRLWRHRDFLKFWVSDTVSQFGSAITLVALPLTAVITLGATPFQMGVLTACERLPFLLFGLTAGVTADRMDRRRIMIFTSVLRAFFLILIPATVFLGLSSIEMLYVSVFAIGIATVYFDVAYWSYAPQLLPSDLLLEGNSKLAISASTAESIGPGLAAVLLKVIAPPYALLLNGLSFLASSVLIALIPPVKQRPPVPQHTVSIWSDIGGGFNVVRRSQTLLSLIRFATIWNFFVNMVTTVLVLFMVKDLGLSALQVGVIFAIQGVGFVVGSFLVTRLTPKFGHGPSIVGTAVIYAATSTLICMVEGNSWIAFGTLSAVLFVCGVGASIVGVNVVSLRQLVTPDDSLGRVTATMRFVTWGVIPIAAILSGALADKLGLRAMLMLVTSSGLCSAILGCAFGKMKSGIGISNAPFSDKENVLVHGG
jgi:MFS family permease